jgi:hypothetical protein
MWAVKLLNSLLLFSLASSILSAHASEFMARVEATYQQTDRNYDLDCRYSLNESYKLIRPIGQTRRDSSSLSRDYVIESDRGSVPMSFKVFKNGSYEVLLDRTHLSKGYVKDREFFIAPIQDRNFAETFDTKQIHCSVNFAYALPYELKDGDYHISVHPQKLYDWQSRLTMGIEELLRETKFKSIIFLESTNFRGEYVELKDFFEGREARLQAYDFDTELSQVPASTDLVVSPAGNSRFDVKAKNQINITLTGGNHNYCIWNVTRHLLQDFFNSSSEARLTVRYKLGLIIAQPKGMEQTGLNFPNREINQSNLLRDLLSTPSRQASYHGTFIQFFTGYLAREYDGMFKTYTLKYSAPGYNQEVVVNGTGTRNLKVDFIYE